MPRSFARSAVPFLLLALTHLSRASAQGPRFAVNPIYPVPLSPQLNAVRLLDTRQAIAVGEHGVVLRTEDAGVTWARIETGSDTPLHGVATQGTTAIAVGERGTVLRSADAGLTWLRVASQTDVELRSVAIASSGRAIAVGADGTVLSSKDAGASWTRISSPTTVMLRAVTFVRDTLAIAVGDGGAIVASSNGGSSWAARRSGSSVQLRAIAFADANHGVVVGGDDRRWRSPTQILVTADGGTTWSRVASPENSRLYGLAATHHSFVAVGEDGTLLRGDNFGTAWKKDTTVSGAWLGGVSLAGDVGFVVGAGGRILRSEHGSEWKPVAAGPKELGFPINSIARPSRNVVIVAGGAPGPKARPVIFRSIDGGATFTTAKADSAGPVIFVAFRDSLVGIAVGQWGTVLRTVDGGASWSRVEVDTKRNLRMVAFADSATAVLVGALSWKPLVEGQAMFRTVDAGRTWTPVRSGSRGIMMGIAFRARALGFAVGAAGAILRSRDGGATWTKMEQRITNTILRGVAILDEKTIVVAGDHGVVLRSTDGGSRWAKVESGVDIPLMALRFSDDRFGIAVGSGDRAIFTEDGGLHWIPIALGMHLNLTSVDIGNPTLLGGRGGMARLDPRFPAQSNMTGIASSRGGTPQ